MSRAVRGQAAGQSLMEYALLVAVVAAAVVAMSIYVRRAVQANIKQFEKQTIAEPCLNGEQDNRCNERDSNR